MSAISTWYDHLVGTQLSSGGVAGVLTAFVKNVSYKLKLPDGSTVVVSAELAIRAKRLQLDGMQLTFDEGQTGKVCSLDGVSFYSADYNESGLVKVKWTHDAPTTRSSHVDLVAVLEKVPDLLLGVQFYKTYDNDELYLVTVASSKMDDGELVYRLNFEDGDYDYMKKLDLLVELAPAMPTERIVRVEDLAIYTPDAVTAPQAPDAVANVKFWGRSIYIALGQKGTNVIVNDLLNTDDGQPGEAKASNAISKLDILVAINGVPIRGRPVEEVAHMINGCTRPLTLSFRKPRSKKSAVAEASTPLPTLAQSAARLPTLKPVNPKAATPKSTAPALAPKPTPGPSVEPATKRPSLATPVAVPVVQPPAAKPSTAPAKSSTAPAKSSTAPAKPTAVPLKPIAVPAKPTAVPVVPPPAAKPSAAPAAKPSAASAAKPLAAPAVAPLPPPTTRHEPLSSEVIAAVVGGVLEVFMTSDDDSDLVDSDGTEDLSAEADYEASSYDTISESSSDDEAEEEERQRPSTSPSKRTLATTTATAASSPPSAAHSEKVGNKKPSDVSGKPEPSIKAENLPSPSNATKKRPATETVSGKAVAEMPSLPKKLKTSDALTASQRPIATESPSTKKLPLTSKPRSSSPDASPKETDLIGSRARRPRRIHVLVHKASLHLSLANIEPNQFPIITSFLPGPLGTKGEVELDGRVQIGAQLVTVNGQSTQALSTSQVASLIKSAPRPVNVSFLNASVELEKS
ncbi:hypothetical protein SDRG_04272 [Saprolegnia diclina VS20]|uniref:PDZ domain-containing protein n=1 Tax=Saprolegnia diclina (strain VS20) TaxID=1156394 RepID=T0S7B5_SAPDV|nr:hypothetical protein SDRG_04272 [Saprolegnia diclina VS20]EQC38567.1 hypothetical protein SDRG_04272 [Saprolegnia diclina VS20]|eukprot:XP_008608159.1 hypothetical protein SDRG_04272 [Saprolegnia diclina VS20]